MSFITTILPLSLEQYLANNLQNQQLPIAFSLSEKAVTLADNILSEPATEEQIELVVFQQLPLSQLLALQNDAQLEIITLTTINHRNNQTSCRFQVNCADFIKTRKAVADFALANKIEAALLTQVPKLAVPGLLVMDMDSTTIEIECIDEIAKLAGVGEEVAEVTERAMLGELDFAQSLHQRVATLAESPESILSDVAKNIPLMAGLKPLIVELKKHNWRIAIASGGFTYFADHLKETLNLDAAFANTLEIIDGKLTGKVLGSVVDAQVKADSLAILSKEYQIPVNQTVAMGDGANDLVMMAAASFGVAFHAKPIVLAQADSSINEQGLDCLLHWLA
ncbi:phosphoserine phosphatase SerB [Colwellia psychrerythraea]|uniref:phosphoserine phosphatase SerB n=1 Tax=Colwellia psychrerythraea TaxID=28229 RepID=UPI0002F06B21|nr:phosphoserine phosphatase SerB [Colwellia psychrerythraea]